MKAVRILLSVLAVALLLAVIAAGLAFVPAVQTWAAQRFLAGSAVAGSIGSLTANPGSIEVTDLRLRSAGAELTVPELTAELPVLTAVWSHRVGIRHLAARGWTLDLRSAFAFGYGGTAAPAGAAAAAAFHELLGRRPLPCDLALDGAELEGDVILPGADPKESVRVHVSLSGGGLAAGREGAFEFEAASTVLDSQRQVTDLSARGRIRPVMDTPRTLGRLGIKAGLSARGGAFPAGLVLSLEGSVVRGAGDETYALNLSRGARRVAALTARLADGGDRLSGTWNIDGRDTDFSPFLPGHALPVFQAAGKGRFDCEAGFGRLHAQGDIGGEFGRLEALDPALKNAGKVRLAAGFDAVRAGGAIRVERLNVSIAGPGPEIAVRSLLPFVLDEHTGGIGPDRPGPPGGAGGDWLEVSLRRLPLALVTGLPAGWSFAGGVATADFAFQARPDGFELRPRGPFTASGVSLRHAGALVARRLDLSAALSVRKGSDGWRLQVAPLKVASGGRALGEIDAKLVLPAGDERPPAVSGTWRADLHAIAAQVVLPDLAWLPGRSASGSFAASGGPSPTWDGKLAAAGDDPGASLTAGFHTEVGQQGTVSFVIPLRIARDSGASEFSLEGSASDEEAGRRLSLQLNGQDVRWDDVLALASPLAASQTRGQPFWGAWVGSLRLALDRVSAGGKSYADVGASFEVGPGSVRLQGGHVGLDAPRSARIEGELSFSPSAPHPYRLEAKAVIDPFKAGPLFPAAEADSYPSIEGRIAIAATLAGQGDSLSDLAGRTSETFELTSTDAIIRFLKTDVHEGIREKESSRVGDALGSVGSAVGSFFGRNRDGSAAPTNRLSPAAEAMIDFTSETAEIGFDRAAVTAVRDADGSFRLVKIDLMGEREHIAGTGRIAAAPGLPLPERPLRLDLEFWARGRVARLLAIAGLLSPGEDARGFRRLSQPIRLGGALAQVDITPWHRLLVQAAAQPPAARNR